jgi:phosphopantetheinyl transferase
MIDNAWGCRYATHEELRRLQTPGGEHRWLTPREQSVYARLRADARRATWLAGRMLAKRLVADYVVANRLDLPTVQRGRVEIDSGQSGQRRLAPRIRIAGQVLPWSLSISHTRRGVLVALTSTPALRIGVDLVEPAVFGEGFADLWFTPAERHWLRHRGVPHGASLLWAAKEAVYKAVNQGERFYPRQIEILPDTTHGLQCTSQAALTLRVAMTRQGEVAVVAMKGSGFGVQGSGFRFGIDGYPDCPIPPPLTPKP